MALPDNCGPYNFGPDNLGPNNFGPDNLGPNNCGPYNCGLNQEAETSATFGRHVSNRFKITYSEPCHRELSIGI